MKMTQPRSAIAMSLAMCGALLAGSLFAQDATTPRQPIRDRLQRNQNVGVLDAKTGGGGVRASQLIGMNIENSAEESVGEIKDIVLNPQSGDIEYVAVTYGGFLGVGNKMFAVPFEAIKVQRDPDDPTDRDDYVLVMNVTQKQLEGAQGFDEDHWPNFADREFTNELYQRYGVKRRTENLRSRNVDRNIDVNVDRNGIDVDVDRDN